jgi:hypothetical protein
MPQPHLPPAAEGLPTTRQDIERHIDALIDLLDSLDTDPDAEPSLGWTDAYWGPTNQAEPNFMANANGGDDREDEHDGAEPDVDAEPSLGWTDNATQAGPPWGGHPFFHGDDLEEGVGPVRKKRPPSKTGRNVYVGCRVLGCPPKTKSSVPTKFRVRPKGSVR